MWKWIAILFALGALVGCARSAGNFGFGPPPTLEQTRATVNQHLTKYLYHPGSARDLRIERPRAGCFYRGPGKRDICGYQVCVSYSALNQRGGYVNERQSLWITNGFGLHVQAPQTCPGVIEDWDGTEPALAGEFCSAQPEHPDCLRGRKETFVTPLVVTDVPSNTVSAASEKQGSLVDSSQTAFETLQSERWRPATADEMAALAVAADRHLKDGASARYLDVLVGGNPDLPMVQQFCGQVNAKNSWGAYIGYKRFYYAGVGFFAIEDNFNGRFFDEKCK